jgi:hypothetical protein
LFGFSGVQFIFNACEMKDLIIWISFLGIEKEATRYVYTLQLNDSTNRNVIKNSKNSIKYFISNDEFK